MSDMIEVVIDSIRVGLMSQQRVVILREADAERYLPIWIDSYMAEQITFALQEVEVARPMSHDLLKNIIKTLDARVIRVEVSELKDQVFFGNIVLETNTGDTINIDTRPSDALALAVRAHVPIMIAVDVMDSAGVIPEEDLGEQELISADKPTSETGNEESGERLSVFEDFIDNLDISAGKDGDPDEEEDK
jgi:bifunctional DNase/RNase